MRLDSIHTDDRACVSPSLKKMPHRQARECRTIKQIKHVQMQLLLTTRPAVFITLTID